MRLYLSDVLSFSPRFLLPRHCTPFLRLLLLTLFLQTLLQPAVAQELKTFGAAPTFVLQDSRGRQFSSDQLRGRVWIANFFFSTCNGPCPIQAAHLQKLAAKFPSTAALSFVSITADPKNDTSEVLAAYANKLKADTNRWHFLTGSEETIQSLMNEGFSLGSGAEPIYHSSRFVLVDSSGTIRGYYRGTEAEEIGKLQTAIKLLLSDNS